MGKTIELECKPGYPRPGDLIDDLIEGTGLVKKKVKSAFFGCWTWDYSEVSDEDWEKIQSILKERIDKLFTSRKIRYGSW